MKYIEKSLIISSLAALGLLSLLATAHASSYTPSLQEIKQYPLIEVQSGRGIQATRAGQCVKWKTRCVKKKFCQPYYVYRCFVCRKYKGYGEYKYHKTCNFNRMQRYRMKGYWCYRYHPYTAGRCNYFYKKYCQRYCYKWIYY